MTSARAADPQPKALIRTHGELSAARVEYRRDIKGGCEGRAVEVRNRRAFEGGCDGAENLFILVNVGCL